MPKKFSDKEKKSIVEALKKAAFESLVTKGVRSTTVDELVATVHIPKGTFYLFYPSKEMLLYDAIMDKEEEVHFVLGERIKEIEEDMSVDELTDIFLSFFYQGFSLGILPLMINGELDIIIRKLPDDVVNEHISKDDDFSLLMKNIFPNLDNNDISCYSAAFRSLFLSATFKRIIGDNFDSSLRLLIKGLIIQMKGVK